MKCVGFLIALFCMVQSKGLKEEFTWSKINFVWPRTSRFGYHQGPSHGNHQGGEFVFPENADTKPSDTDSDTNLNLGDLYIHENNIPMGANRWQNKLFITIPRRRAGVPSTLNYVWTNNTQKHNVPLTPYPNWEINQLPVAGDTGHLVSVYRTAVDACERLWMIDTGLMEIPGNHTQVQPPSIVIIDLLTNQVIRRYTLKPSDYLSHSTLASLVVDVTPTTCDHAYAYIPDLSGYGLIVYNFHENESWRVNHNYFYVESLAGEFFVGGVHFQWNDGVFSVALSEINPDGFRTVYFHSMAGTHIFSVSTRILKDHELATRSYHENDFKVVVDRGQGSQTSSSDLHKSSGVLFLALVNQNGLGCWNTNKPAKPENFDVVHKDDQKFIYPSDVKVYGDEVIVLTNTMPVFLYSHLDYDQTNFRVWTANVNDAVKDSACSRRGPVKRPGYH